MHPRREATQHPRTKFSRARFSALARGRHPPVTQRPTQAPPVVGQSRSPSGSASQRSRSVVDDMDGCSKEKYAARRKVLEPENLRKSSCGKPTKPNKVPLQILSRNPPLSVTDRGRFLLRLGLRTPEGRARRSLSLPVPPASLPLALEPSLTASRDRSSPQPHHDCSPGHHSALLGDCRLPNAQLTPSPTCARRHRHSTPAPYRRPCLCIQKRNTYQHTITDGDTPTFCLHTQLHVCARHHSTLSNKGSIGPWPAP